MAYESRLRGILRGLGFGGEFSEVAAHNKNVDHFCSTVNAGLIAAFFKSTPENLEDRIKYLRNVLAQSNVYLNDTQTNDINKAALQKIKKAFLRHEKAVAFGDERDLYILKDFFIMAEAGPPANIKQSQDLVTRWLGVTLGHTRLLLEAYDRDKPECLSDEDKERFAALDRTLTEKYQKAVEIGRMMSEESIIIADIETFMGKVNSPDAVMTKENINEIQIKIMKLLSNQQLAQSLTDEHRAYLNASQVRLTEVLNALTRQTVPTQENGDWQTMMEFEEDGKDEVFVEHLKSEQAAIKQRLQEERGDEEDLEANDDPTHTV
ncbi:MAG: hypothetical protein K0U37_01995 [Gammaproteobacteria bacterium]|nr:hypothetical protein [Gammaproteobacteria bacterium]